MYGDGGEYTLDEQLHYCTQVLPMGEEKKVTQMLEELGEACPDFHEHEPIQDLIDPNLFPESVLDWKDKEKDLVPRFTQDVQELVEEGMNELPNHQQRYQRTIHLSHHH